MDSENSSQVNEQMKSKVEVLTKAFNAMDKDLNSELTQEEVLDFLNSHTKNGMQFNQNLAHKLIEKLDFDHNGTVNVEEFIKNYVYFESDLKGAQLNLQQKMAQEAKMLQSNKELCRQYQQEQLNSEGFCDNAKITVTVEEVNMQTQLDDIKSIGITILYNDIVKQTNFIAGDTNVRVNEQYVFKPKTRKDHFEFILKGKDQYDREIDIGSKVLNLEGTESQDEYKIEILIPDINDIDKIVADVQTNISFYWSDFDHYSKQVKQTEKKLEKLQKALNQTTNYLNTLNEIFASVPTTQDFNNYIEQDFIPQTENIHQKDNSHAPLKTNPMLEDQLMFDDDEAPNPAISMVEGKLKTIFKQNKIYWIVYIKVLAVLVSILGFLSSFFKPDFPNTLGGILVLLICLFGFRNSSNEKMINFLKLMLYIVVFLIGYDLIWILIYIGDCFGGIDKYTRGNVDGLLKFTMFVTVINELLKGCLGFGIWAQLKKIEKRSMSSLK